MGDSLRRELLKVVTRMLSSKLAKLIRYCGHVITNTVAIGLSSKLCPSSYGLGSADTPEIIKTSSTSSAEKHALAHENPGWSHGSFRTSGTQAISLHRPMDRPRDGGAVFGVDVPREAVAAR